ncbi:protein IQ-DOMAIN 3-like [Rutidosis leptorrhynchoides]|uniref:protein IQ-DOMAIN 3-like n=1 Tax=Rutidosis leptorrhynchoides TaxID=125765 RepID=UPI003A98DCC5
MGKKSHWLSAVKKALTPSEFKENKDKKSNKKSSKKYWFGKQRNVDKDLSQTETTIVTDVHVSPSNEELKLTKAENEQTKHAYSVAYATAVAAEAAVAAAHAAAEVVRLTSTVRFLGKSKEDIAAIRIQTAYRGHLARRTLRAVKGLGRLKSLIEGESVKRQATTTLKCMQTLARVQSQVRSRRIRMSEENRALQIRLLMKHEKEFNNRRSSLGNGWDESIKSKEETEASLQSKQDAALRRERALAYAHTHQKLWNNSAKSANSTFLDPNNPHWGWSWLERWMAARPWENQSLSERDNSFREVGKRVSRPASRQSPSTPPRPSSSSRRIRPESPIGSVDDESRSYYSVQSDRNRRNSLASSVRDDESLNSSPAMPNYMASTMSTKARSRMASPVNSPSPLGSGRKGNSDKGSPVGSAKKRLSFTGSPARTTKRSLEPSLLGSNS